MSAHSDHAKRRGIAVPCAAGHINFGGDCLNCGFSPQMAAMRTELRALEIKVARAMARFDGIVTREEAERLETLRSAVGNRFEAVNNRWEHAD